MNLAAPWLSHLESQQGSFARFVVLGFSRNVESVRVSLRGGKPGSLKFKTLFISWIYNFMVGHPHNVRIKA